jgi:hypothetical protein
MDLNRRNKETVIYFIVKVPYLPGKTERKAINNINVDSPTTAEIEILDVPISTGVPTTKPRFSVGLTLSEEYKRRSCTLQQMLNFLFF